MKHVAGILKEILALVVALQNSPLVVVMLIALAALAVSGFALWRK